MGRVVRQAIEGPLGAVVRFASLEHNVLDVLERRAVKESADYIAAAMPEALGLRSREALWDFALRNAEHDGLWLEFGVFKGYSVNYLARRTDTRVFGFDSFHGLREDWTGGGHARGAFDLAGRLPRVRANVSLLAGWFGDTVPGFLAANPAPVALLHLDCDTYEATAEVLRLIVDRLTPRTVVIMDDYLGFRGYRESQFRAWAEFVAEHGLAYRYAAFNRHAVVVWDVQSGRASEPPPAENVEG
jgi:predicted O-methyltransferase YrrM